MTKTSQSVMIKVHLTVLHLKELIVPTEQSSRGYYEIGSGCVCVGGCACVVNIVNPAVDWPSLLHTLLIVTNLGQDDHWVCPRMSHDFDLHLTFDLDIGVSAKFRDTYFAHHKNLSSTCFFNTNLV